MFIAQAWFIHRDLGVIFQPTSAASAATTSVTDGAINDIDSM